MAFFDYLIYLGIITAIFTILGVSFSLVLGYGGVMQLGHLAFFGIAAYSSAILTLRGVPIPAAAAVSIAIVAIVSLILAVPTVKLKSHYTAVATLSFVLVSYGLARNMELTRGTLGLPGIPALFGSNATSLVFTVAVAAATVILIRRLVGSRFGKVIQAIRDDETAANTLGVNVFAHKTALFVITSLFAAIAGILYAHYTTFIDPEVFNLFDIVTLLAMIIVGGLASMRGAVIGSVLVFLLPVPLRFLSLPPGLVGPLRDMIFAGILLAVLLFRPRGIFGRIDLE